MKFNWWECLTGIGLLCAVGIFFAVPVVSAPVIKQNLDMWVFVGLLLTGIGTAFQLWAHGRSQTLEGVGKVAAFFGWCVTIPSALIFAGVSGGVIGHVQPVAWAFVFLALTGLALIVVPIVRKVSQKKQP